MLLTLAFRQALLRDQVGKLYGLELGILFWGDEGGIFGQLEIHLLVAQIRVNKADEHISIFITQGQFINDDLQILSLIVIGVVELT